MRSFKYGSEAVDYIKSRLCDDGDTLSSLMLTTDFVQRGEVRSELPDTVDPAQLYKFRTDVFWGWPDDAGKDIQQTFVAFVSEFLLNPGTVAVSEGWSEADPNEEPMEIHWLTFASTRKKGAQGFCRFLVGPSTEDQVTYFLSHINQTPLILADLSHEPHVFQLLKIGARSRTKYFRLSLSSPLT